MARGYKQGVILKRLTLLPLLLLRCSSASELEEVPLDQATQRVTGSYKASYLGKKITVRGFATGRALVFPAFHLLPVQNEAGKGIFLEDSGPIIDALQPGDRLEASGTIVERGGLPVLSVQSVTRQGTLLVPPPRAVTLAELDGFTWLGSLVMTTGQVVSLGSGSAGSYADIEDGGHVIRVYLPRVGPAAREWQLRPGDRIRVIGYASQYCPVPPHNRFFQVIVDDASRIIPLERAWTVDPSLLFGFLGILALGLAIWWLLERQWTSRRKVIRNMNRLGEDLLSAKSTEAIVQKIERILPRLLKASWTRLYIYDHRENTLKTLEAEDEERLAVDLNAKRDSPFAAAAFAFRNRSVLVIPDVRVTPLISQKAALDLPRGLIYIPMISCGETLGLIEIGFQTAKARATRDDQVCQQHLGNQAAAALRRVRELALQEQLSRSEKLSATAQLVSGIATELKAPLQLIGQLCSSLLRNPADSLTERSLRAITAQAGRASGIVNRLVSFSESESAPTGSVDLAKLLQESVQSKQQDLAARGIPVEHNLSDRAITVHGNSGQLEQVFLNLLSFAEQQVIASEGKPLIIVSLHAASKSALLRIQFPTAKSELSKDEQLDKDAALFAGEDLTGDVLSLAFCRGVFNAHNGNIKLIRNDAAAATLEVVVPLAAATTPRTAPTAVNDTPWTVLIVEPDGAVQRKLLSLLIAHRHRVIPVVSAEEAIDLMNRMRFDVVFCSVRLPGKTWIEFKETMPDRDLAFILVTEGYDERLASSLRSTGAFLLRKPLNDREFEQLAASIKPRPVNGTRAKQTTESPLGVPS